MPHVEQELFTLLEHLKSPRLLVGFVISGQCIVDRLCFSFSFRPLQCLSFFYLRLLIIPLVSFKFSMPQGDKP